MKVSVIITLKKDVLDPQGKVIQQTLDGMGFDNINEVRQGKYFEINMNEKDFTLKDAIKFLKYPKKINEEITIHIGPYGYYMKYNGKNYKVNQSGKYTEDYCLSIIQDK